jgi:hypothetical protein
MATSPEPRSHPGVGQGIVCYPRGWPPSPQGLVTIARLAYAGRKPARHRAFINRAGDNGARYPP